jgi:hypothetical protein
MKRLKELTKQAFKEVLLNYGNEYFTKELNKDDIFFTSEYTEHGIPEASEIDKLGIIELQIKKLAEELISNKEARIEAKNKIDLIMQLYCEEFDTLVKKKFPNIKNFK